MKRIAIITARGGSKRIPKKNIKEFCGKPMIAYTIEAAKKSKYINLHIIKYFKFLAGKKLFKKMIKELINFHFPILGYVIFKIY